MQTRFPGSVQLAGQQLPGPAPHQDVPETGVHSELTNPSCHLPLPVHRGFAGDTRQRIGGHAAAHRGRAAAWGRRSAGQRTWREGCEVDRNPGDQPAPVNLAGAGGALAARWGGAFANDPVAVSYAAGAWSGPAVQRLAYAVAVGIPVPGIQAPGPGSPSAAWSSRTGDWRLVPIEPPSGKRGHRLAQPGLTQFDGQVIARWMTHSSPEDEEISTWSIVVDDGGRGRSFDVRPDVYGQVRLGDLVGVRVDPRSMKLLELTPARRPPGRLVAAEEQAGLWRRQIGRA